ncbi:MAG: 50S ribosomal protein L4 [Gemmatimonadota bacterium]|nr:50S ribosomal protein L4 [Gemmatimonadota bacterium]MDH3366839.1 50S ribosomal protein L4 [Gemmatimonadota bacterium]MDH3477228.1 50S ribosomal protein L4 [Gemmatimonadota bacterium]MDH5551060.1 50S ribosomal protein L4 [Gemmatimonadota bacterium]
MLEARLYTATAQEKGSYALPGEFDGTVNQAALYHAVRAYRNHQRQGTHSTKTRAEVSGGGRKPYRQKGTGRARQGTIRAPHYPGGGVAFGPKPRRYRTGLPRKVKRLARQSALNSRANEGAFVVIEDLAFEEPKTRRLVELIDKLGLDDHKVLLLMADHREAVYRSGRNVPDVHVMLYQDVSAYEVLWADTVVVEESAIGGHVVAGSAPKRAKRAVAGASKKKAGGRAMSRKRATAKQTGRKKATKSTKKKKSTRKGGKDA